MNLADWTNNWATILSIIAPVCGLAVWLTMMFRQLHELIRSLNQANQHMLDQIERHSESQAKHHETIAVSIGEICRLQKETAYNLRDLHRSVQEADRRDAADHADLKARMERS